MQDKISGVIPAKDLPSTNQQSKESNLKQTSNKQPHPTEPNTKLDAPILTIIHFNDVYDIQPKGGSMGVVNFKAKLDQLKKQNPEAMILFSGDCFSPSTLTNIKEGWQMVYSLNTMGIDVACYGNHEFDFQGKLHTIQLAKACNFPWLLGNITYIVNGDLLGNGMKYVVKQVNGLRIGIMGVAGEDWIGILSDQYDGQLEYEDYVTFAKKAADHLRTVEHCTFIIALTHQRNHPDLVFPTKTDCVDLILGGHDHVILTQMVNKVPVIKSGANFNNIGLIKIYDKNSKKGKQGLRYNFDYQVFKIGIAEHYDKQLKQYVDKLMKQYEQFDDVVGYTEVELETRFDYIRRKQSNYGNFICDLARLYYDTNAAIINSGSIRNDMVIPEGQLSYSKISNIINSPLVVKMVPGTKIREILEWSVAALPEGFAGAFLMVSGIRFQYDWKAQPRVGRVWIGHYELDVHKHYTIVMTSYLAHGGDGYDVLKQCEMILDQIKAITTLNLLLKFFKAPDSHQQYESIQILEKTSGMSQQSEAPPDIPILKKKPSVRVGRIKELRSGFFQSEEGTKITSICPTIDGRVKCTTVE